MKHWFFGTSLFLVTFIAGVTLVVLTRPVPVTLELAPPAVAIPSISNTNLLAAEPAKDFIPEFTNVRIPEEFETGDFYHFQPVFEGSAYLGQCELTRNANGPWLAVYKNGDKYSLEPIKVKFGRPEIDSFGTFFQMYFRNSENALFLVSHDSKLRPGPVETLYLTPRNQPDDEDGLLGAGFRREFILGQQVYTVRISSGTTENGGRASVLVLESNSKKEILYFRTQLVDESNIGRLEWVGDLDNDSRLDLLFSFFQQNGGGKSYILFLSSIAENGQHVRPYAFFHTQFKGC